MSTKRQMIAWIPAMGILFIFQWGLYLIFAEKIFWFLPCGENLLWVRAYDGIAFFSLLAVLAIQIAIFWKLFNHAYKSIAAFSAILGLGAFFLFTFPVGIRYCNPSEYYQTFSSAQWKSKQNRSIKVVRFIVREETLLGKSRSEVTDLLGTETRYGMEGDNQVYFETEDWYSPLLVEFVDGKVSGVSVACVD